MARQKKGRGWHGDSAAHAAAGRKGGLASRRGRKKTNNSNPQELEEFDQASM